MPHEKWMIWLPWSSDVIHHGKFYSDSQKSEWEILKLSLKFSVWNCAIHEFKPCDDVACTFFFLCCQLMFSKWLESWGISVPVPCSHNLSENPILFFFLFKSRPQPKPASVSKLNYILDTNKLWQGSDRGLCVLLSIQAAIDVSGSLYSLNSWLTVLPQRASGSEGPPRWSKRQQNKL